MLSVTPARSRRRARRVLLATVMAACTLPAGASAAIVEADPDISGGLRYRATQETNTLTVRDLVGGGLEVSDLRGLTSRTPLCAAVDSTKVRCALGLAQFTALLGDRSDRATFATALPVHADGGTGDDTFIAGSGPAASRVDYLGNSGFDRISYAPADRAVRVRNDARNNDGRIGLDQDNVLADVEQLGGSRFNDIIADVDTFLQSTRELIGGPGDDFLQADNRKHVTIFNMGPFADGADTIVGDGEGVFTAVDYSKRSRPVTATIDFNGGDDGEAGEGDNILGLHGYVAGGQGADTIRSRPGSTHGDHLDGQGGDDTLEGANGPDLIYAFSGGDTVLANGGNDAISADDDFRDIVGCGVGTDSADLDSGDGFSSCETRRVGVLRLAPKTVRATAGQPVKLRLSWRHPRAWKQLDAVTLRLTQDNLPVGAVTIRPRGARITDDGAVTLVRRDTRLTRHGKTVSARLALRLDESLAGQTLTAEVEATDRRARRQLERAGRIRVSG